VLGEGDVGVVHRVDQLPQQRLLRVLGVTDSDKRVAVFFPRGDVLGESAPAGMLVSRALEFFGEFLNTLILGGLVKKVKIE